MQHVTPSDRANLGCRQRALLDLQAVPLAFLAIVRENPNFASAYFSPDGFRMLIPWLEAKPEGMQHQRSWQGPASVHIAHDDRAASKAHLVPNFAVRYPTLLRCSLVMA